MIRTVTSLGISCASAAAGHEARTARRRAGSGRVARYARCCGAFRVRSVPEPTISVIIWEQTRPLASPRRRRCRGSRANSGEKKDESADRVFVLSRGRVLARRLRKRICVGSGYVCGRHTRPLRYGHRGRRGTRRARRTGCAAVRGGSVLAEAVAESLGLGIDDRRVGGFARSRLDHSSPPNAERRDRGERGQEHARRRMLRHCAAGARVRRRGQPRELVGRSGRRLRLAHVESRHHRRPHGQHLDRRQRSWPTRTS